MDSGQETRLIMHVMSLFFHVYCSNAAIFVNYFSYRIVPPFYGENSLKLDSILRFLNICISQRTKANKSLFHSEAKCRNAYIAKILLNLTANPENFFSSKESKPAFSANQVPHLHAYIHARSPS